MDDGNHKSIENVKPHVFLGPEAFKKQTNLNKKIIQKKHQKQMYVLHICFFLGGGGAESWPVWGGLAGGPRAGSGRVVSGGGPRARSGGRVSGGGPRAGSGGSLSGGGPKTSMF